MKKKNSLPHESWSIEDGDYQRSREDTFTYQKQLRRKKIIKNSTYALMFLIALLSSFVLLAHKFI